MLSIFLCVSGYLYELSEEIACLVLLPIFFEWVIYFFILSGMSCLYILETNPLLLHSQIFPPILKVVFLSFYGFLCCTESFTFN